MFGARKWDEIKCSQQFNRKNINSIYFCHKNKKFISILIHSFIRSFICWWKPARKYSSSKAIKKTFFLITCFYYSYINSRCFVGHIHMEKRTVSSWLSELSALSFVSRQNPIKIGWYDIKFIHQKWHQPILKVSICSLLILQFWSDRCIWRIWIDIVIILRQLKNSHDRDRKTRYVQDADDDISCKDTVKLLVHIPIHFTTS